MKQQLLDCEGSRWRFLMDLRESCQVANAAEQEKCFRQAALLFGSSAIESKIAVGAFESAAFEMLGSATPMMLSYDGSGRAMATIVTPLDNGQSDVEITAEAETPALALLAAYASVICEGMNGVLDPARVLSAHGTPGLH